MWKTFAKTSIGFSHIKAGKGCQDYSARYQDNARAIITACDGHGGDIYIRSDRGSKFASEAVMAVLKKFDAFQATVPYKEMEKKLRLEILCEWNARVERDLAENPITEEETAAINDDKKFKLKINPVKAYGTTLHGAMVVGNKIVCVGIGDGGVFFLKGKTLLEMRGEDEDEPVANITYSMCQEDAYEHIVVGVFEAKEVDAVFVCTDGAVNPYRNYENFRKSFILPMTEKLGEGEDAEVEEFIKKLGTEIGVGDDVSVAVLLQMQNSYFSQYGYFNMANFYPYWAINSLLNHNTP